MEELRITYFKKVFQLNFLANYFLYTQAVWRRLNNIISSVQFSRSVVSNSLRPHESQHVRPPCPSPTPGVHSDSRPSSQGCHPAMSSSVIPFSSCPQSLPASESFAMSQLFTWGGQSTGVSASASFLPKKSQGWSPSEWTGWISLQSKRLSRVFSNTTVQKHHFFSTQPSSQSNSHIHSIKTDICSSSFLGLISSQMLCLLINTLSAYYFYLQYLLYILSFKRKKLALPWFSSSITALFSQSLTSKELFTLAFGLPW